MPFLDKFYRIISRESVRRHETILQRLSDLNSRLDKLESGLEQEKAATPPLLIQHADKVVIEKVDLSSHLDTLQIETLEGQLNIGVTYHGIPKPDELFPVTSEAKAKPSSATQSAGSADAADDDQQLNRTPQYHIRARPQNGRPAK